MKTTTHSTNRPIRHLPGILCSLGLLLTAGTLASCGTGSSIKPVSSPVALQPSHWFKAQNNPPTYFPKGVPADHPTTYSDGMWVLTGDPVGTRYFIPVRGVDTRVLSAEAMSMRTPEQREKLEKGGSTNANLAENLGKVASGLGYALLEVDRQGAIARNREGYGPMKSEAGLWENKQRR